MTYMIASDAPIFGYSADDPDADAWFCLGILELPGADAESIRFLRRARNGLGIAIARNGNKSPMAMLSKSGQCSIATRSGQR